MEVAYVLCYEAVFGEGLKPHGPAERAVLAAKASLLAVAKRLQEDTQQSSKPEPQPHPRWARVNTLKLSVAAALTHFKDTSKPGWQPAFEVSTRNLGRAFYSHISWQF